MSALGRKEMSAIGQKQTLPEGGTAGTAKRASINSVATQKSDADVSIRLARHKLSYVRRPAELDAQEYQSHTYQIRSIRLNRSQIADPGTSNPSVSSTKGPTQQTDAKTAVTTPATNNLFTFRLGCGNNLNLLTKT